MRNVIGCVVKHDKFYTAGFQLKEQNVGICFSLPQTIYLTDYYRVIRQNGVLVPLNSGSSTLLQVKHIFEVMLNVFLVFLCFRSLLPFVW